MSRKSGVLLNVSSLPGQYGIGGFSKEAEIFIDEIAAMGFKVWQTLPLTAIGWGNSPYSGISAFAGNFMYVDPSRLFNLLSQDEINEAKYGGDIYLTNYDFASYAKAKALRTAYSRADGELKAKIASYVKDNASWLPDYAVYMTLKTRFNNASWINWPQEYRKHTPALVEKIHSEDPVEVEYYYFEQYVFDVQWGIIKEHAKACGVEIFGDLPIYLAYDSADVWANPSSFLLSEDLRPKKVAGVPPDYFAKDGQLWGNPLYDYKAMEKDGYKWWVSRLKRAHEMYDIVRIDHFRGLYKYWAVDAKAETAKDGVWEDGPKMKLFKAAAKAIPDLRIVAEDLGLMTEDVYEFVEKTGFPGMRVLQFGFDGDPKNRHLTYNYDSNCVAYTGTHDNDTTLGWLLSMDEETRNKVLDYVNCDGGYGWASGGGNCRATKNFVRAVIASNADLAVIPMQDLCGYGSDTRMNIPGQAVGCWLYRTNYTAISNIDGEYMRKINRLYGRA